MSKYLSESSIINDIWVNIKILIKLSQLLEINSPHLVFCDPALEPTDLMIKINFVDMQQSLTYVL